MRRSSTELLAFCHCLIAVDQRPTLSGCRLALLDLAEWDPDRQRVASDLALVIESCLPCFFFGQANTTRVQSLWIRMEKIGSTKSFLCTPC